MGLQSGLDGVRPGRPAQPAELIGETGKPGEQPRGQTQGSRRARRADETSRLRVVTSHRPHMRRTHMAVMAERPADNTPPPVHDRHPGGGPRRPACAHRGHALAREGDRRGRLAGRAAGDDAGARALLGDEYDWRKCEARLNAYPQFVTEIDGLDIHFVHARSKHEDALPRHRLPRMARLAHRADEDRRPAHRPDGAWRQRLGRLPRGDPEHAGLRVLGQADRDRLGCDPHRARLGGADEAPRLHAVRGGRRRLGRDPRRCDGRWPRRPRGADRDPHHHPRRVSGRHRTGDRDRWRAAVRPLSRRATRG